MRFLLAFWICCFVLSVSAQGIEPHFRLVDLVSMAKGYNAVFLSGKADIDIRREDENIARSAFLPQASVNANVVTETKETGKESRNNLRFSLSETYSLSRLRQWEAAKKTSEATRRRYDAAKQTLYLQVINAWLLAQESADGLRLIEARIKNLTEQLKRAEALAEPDAAHALVFYNHASVWPTYKHNWSEQRIIWPSMNPISSTLPAARRVWFL